MNKKNQDTGPSDGDLIKKIEQLLKELPEKLPKIKDHCGAAHAPLNYLVNGGSNLILFLEDLKIIGKTLPAAQKKNNHAGMAPALRLKDCAHFERSTENALQIFMTFNDKEKEKAAASCFNTYYNAWGLNFLKEDKKWIVTFPPLSLERRESFVKKSKELHHHSVMEVGHVRQEIRDEIKKLKQKDSGVRLEKQLQDIIDKFNKELEQYAHKIQERLLKL
jgi:ribosome recycling factor